MMKICHVLSSTKLNQSLAYLTIFPVPVQPNKLELFSLLHHTFYNCELSYMTYMSLDHCDHSEFNENSLSSPVAAGSLVPASIHIVTAPEHDRDEHHGADHDEHHGADHDGEKINHCNNEFPSEDGFH